MHLLPATFSVILLGTWMPSIINTHTKCLHARNCLRSTCLMAKTPAHAKWPVPYFKEIRVRLYVGVPADWHTSARKNFFYLNESLKVCHGLNKTGSQAWNILSKPIQSFSHHWSILWHVHQCEWTHNKKSRHARKYQCKVSPGQKLPQINVHCVVCKGVSRLVCKGVSRLVCKSISRPTHPSMEKHSAQTKTKKYFMDSIKQIARPEKIS